jgi:ABC-type bacteriocin/lantibiotic exporter with double-glycine peptidase domain
MARALTLLAAALAATAQPAATWLDIPFVRQEKNGCGAACLAMVVGYWKAQGAAALPDPDPAAIQRALYSPEARGISGREMERYLRDAGFRVFVFRGEWADVSGHLAKGRPLIACLGDGAGASRHYVVVAGVDHGVVLVNDPARRKLARLRRENFEREWAAAGNWMLLAVPRTGP